MAISVKLQVFEGPLDLLLHLIDINKIDIYDIPITDITDQYLEYIRQMDDRDMNVTSEFLVMAATLLDIKCRMLLPREVDEEGEEIDPREELVERLLQYKMYKSLSYTLRDRSEAASNVLFRGKFLPDEVKEYEPPVNYEELIGDNTLATLNAVFRDVMRRADNRVDPVRSSFGRIEPEAVNIGEKLKDLRQKLIHSRRTTFRGLLENAGSRSEIVVAFLIILEMMKTGAVKTSQEETFGEIEIEVSDEELLTSLNARDFGAEEEKEEEDGESNGT